MQYLFFCFIRHLTFKNGKVRILIEKRNSRKIISS
jgi:hypothetical protein